MMNEIIDKYLCENRKKVFDIVMGERADYPMIWHCWKFSIWPVSSKSLRDWIMVAWEMQNWEGLLHQVIFGMALENIESSLGKPWSQVREELEGMEG